MLADGCFKILTFINKITRNECTKNGWTAVVFKEVRFDKDIPYFFTIYKKK